MEKILKDTGVNKVTKIDYFKEIKTATPIRSYSNKELKEEILKDGKLKGKI